MLSLSLSLSLSDACALQPLIFETENYFNFLVRFNEYIVRQYFLNKFLF